ncbi:unnamed protein product [Linum trigynum]|uniref:Uncharacterized protein n=1 Tax=Linum trigynum TaxID=586398 RepID=A0AAV2E201_9ROSI
MSSSRLSDLEWARVRQQIEYTLAELKKEARDRGWAATAATEEIPSAGSGERPATTRWEGAAALSVSEGVATWCAAAGELEGASEAGGEDSRQAADPMAAVLSSWSPKETSTTWKMKANTRPESGFAPRCLVPCSP